MQPDNQVLSGIQTHEPSVQAVKTVHACMATMISLFLYYTTLNQLSLPHTLKMCIYKYTNYLWFCDYARLLNCINKSQFLILTDLTSLYLLQCPTCFLWSELQAWGNQLYLGKNTDHCSQIQQLHDFQSGYGHGYKPSEVSALASVMKTIVD